MFNVAMEMPSGARSRGFDRKTEAEAVKVAESLERQLLARPSMVCDVITFLDGAEFSRRKIDNVG